MTQDLLDTLARLHRALAYDYRIVPQEVPDAPIFLALSLPLTPAVSGLKPRLPAGRGLTRLQALVSSGAEAIELRASLAQNNAARIAALPRIAGTAMVAARDLSTGAEALVPAQQVFLDFAAATGETLRTDARSTGCATAATPAEAIRMALFECIERDAIAFWWHGGKAASALPKDLIDESEPRLTWWLERRQRRFHLLGLVSETGLPVVMAVSADADGRNVITGAAARFDPAAAALAAVTEMIQTEVSYARALRADNRDATVWAAHASLFRQPQFAPPADGTPPGWQSLDDAGLLHSLARCGLRALAVDLTLPEDPLTTWRVLVPGLCDMAAGVDQPRLRRHLGLVDPALPLPRHLPEPF